MNDRFNNNIIIKNNKTKRKVKVTIEKKDYSTNNKSDNIGEYVDFEELE